MKKIFILLLISFVLNLPGAVNAQNVGTGINEPSQTLHVNGGKFIITQTLIQTNALPTTLQTITMVNSSSTQFKATDSTGKFYDPAGPSGNYIANLNAQLNIPAVTNCVGFEVSINSLDLGTGDSLIISELSSWRNVQLAIGNNYNEATGTRVFNTPTLYFLFKSNGDASVGRGFEIVFKRKFDAVPAIPINNLAGKVLMYDAKNASLSIGNFNKSPLLPAAYTLSIGNSELHSNYSMSLGENNFITSSYSTAVGVNNKITGGQYSAAFGIGNQLTGTLNFAFGYGLKGSGETFGGHTLYMGDFNSYPNVSKPYFVIGNGWDNNNRSNALEVGTSGTLIHTYTQLGSDAPPIKMKYLTGTLPSADNSWTFISTGFTLAEMEKIISFQVLVDNGTWKYIPNTSHPGSYFRTNIDATNIAVGTMSGQSFNLYGKPIKVLITYQQF